MAISSATMLLGTQAPDFALREPRTGRTIRLADFTDRDALLVMFICHHCPYVQHLRHGLADFGRDYEGSRLGIVAISSNDVASYPTDGPEQMAVDAEELDYRFPYLYDESQEVARAYGAVCTPDFFLFDAERALVYQGRFDETRPNLPGRVTGSDLRAAVDAVLTGERVRGDQHPSMGCSIKWKPGNAPGYPS